MRKHAVVLTLTLLELLALVLLAFFWLVMRPDLMSTYAIVDSSDARLAALPAATRVALTTSLVPFVGAGGFALFALAWLWRRGVNARTRLLGAALVWTVLGLGWAVWAAYAPAFEQLESLGTRAFIRRHPNRASASATSAIGTERAMTSKSTAARTAVQSRQGAGPNT